MGVKLGLSLYGYEITKGRCNPAFCVYINNAALFLVSYLFTSSLFSEWKSTFSSYKDVKGIVEGDIDNDINRNNPCHKKLIEERKVDDDKDKRQCNDTYQSLMLC